MCSPHTEFTGYSLEHPVYRHFNLRVQSKESSSVGGEQVLAETLELTQKLFKGVGSAMEKSMTAFSKGKK